MLVRVGIVVATLGVVSCSPSHRMVHQGNVYFEHCYGADFDPTIPTQDKEVCWSAWLAHYTRHQPGHRIDYAMRRMEALQMGEPSPTLPRHDGSPTEGPKGSWPPQTESTVRVSSAELAPNGDNPDIPHGCETICRAQHDRCSAGCDAKAEWCEKLCEREQGLCMGGCY